MIILILLILIFLFISPRWRTAYQIKCWRRALNLDFHGAHFHTLYASVNGFNLSREARKNCDAPEYIYGEIEFDSFIALLSCCQTTSNTIFYDLGSGTGKAVLASAMVFAVNKSIGIELLTPLQQEAQLLKQKLQEITFYQQLSTEIEFRQGDIFNAQFTDATLIFISSTAFFGERWLKLSHHLEQVKPGACIITLSKSLKSAFFKVKRITPIRMSWGIVNAYIHYRVKN